MNSATEYVNMWLGSDRGALEVLDATALALVECEHESETAQADYARRRMRYKLEDYVRERLEAEIEGGTMWADLIAQALRTVEWQEIADSYIGYAREAFADGARSADYE
jgi:hypothetical protein